MGPAVLHHVLVLTEDLERSLAFYRDVLGLKPIPRPPFDTAGHWLEAGGTQVHLLLYPEGSFRRRSTVDVNDVHFALRVADFEAAMRDLASHGYREDLADGDPKRLVARRKGLAGFPQVYMLDPDQNIVEINAAG